MNKVIESVKIIMDAVGFFLIKIEEILQTPNIEQSPHKIIELIILLGLTFLIIQRFYIKK